MDVTVRDARAEDIDAVTAFADSTWDGWDYVPDAWDDWLDEGVTLVADADGRPVGTVHGVTRDDEAWLEGLRVDEDYRREGIASALVDGVVERTADRGVSVVRCMAFDGNEAGVSFLESVGFGRTATVRHGRGFGFPYGSALEPANFDESLEVVRGTEAFEAVDGLYATSDWRMWSVPDSVNGYEGEVLGFVEDGEVRGIALCDGTRINETGEERRTELVLGFVWSEPRYVSQFALDIRGEAREREIHDAVVFVPDDQTVDAFDQAGYDFDRHDHIYEKVIQ
ncbi:GNAT family N-acetyltransferase [Haladaptatus sp. F3-133]|uniref:GNAT family N-acetyltransferase n=1 Tax=Halorutilus salinus TaxID=2487751 RepID=A0A9Q4GGP5_9EURY|nr:GNAT family N-acetyltransferase [Halorutilus salinus]MCX2819364.1 GNAT family N-acetyltransferase [Halorutilus salinus]